MNLPSAVKVDGKLWKLFSADFKSPDGTFSAYFYAIDPHHASYQIEAMKETAELRDISTDD